MPAAKVSLGDQAVAFAAKAGLFLDPWQQDVLRGAMGLRDGGRWAARDVGLLVPRQNGKGAVLEARELFGLFVLNELLIIHSAHKFDTSQEHFLRMRALIEGNPDLDRHVANVYTANGKESITLKNGCRLKFKARTISGSGRGFSCDCLVLDEAMLLPEQALSAMGPSMSARKNPQTWFTSSAGTPESAALWRIVKRGRENGKRLAYYEWGCDLGVDFSTVEKMFEAAAESNPGLGYRLSLEEMENEFELLTAEDFAREHLGIWDDQATDTIFPPGQWESLADPESVVTGLMTFAVEVAEDRSWACVAGCGTGPDGVHAEAGDYRRHTDWIVGRAKELAAKNPASQFVIRPSGPAGSLMGDFEREQIPVVTASQTDYAQACGDIHDAVVNRELRHLGQPHVDVAVRGAKKKPSGDAFVWDLRKSGLDISPLVAVTLAHWGHVQGAGPSVYEQRGVTFL